ncbi:hypothetical protein H6F93_08755 [Leptolyngbya sp. FACHB-671]|nr:hypothetical protein [Leptolyngbya sp. FACHB-671]MBD1869085.1 hypothetical protein [Cyanobacteria bacterium FACHB-471]MBD2067620.1 hypothetical protein [Leptolyngbya sp. FACHB-671]
MSNKKYVPPRPGFPNRLDAGGTRQKAEGAQNLPDPTNPDNPNPPTVG